MVDLSAPFEVVARHRPVDLLAGVDGAALAGVLAPYAGTRARLVGTGPAELAMHAGATRVLARFAVDAVSLDVTVAGRTSTHRSRRHGRPRAEVGAVALTLTGPQVTALTRERGAWTARARFDLTERDDVGPARTGAEDPHDPAWLATLRSSAAGPLADLGAGRFGQLGLRDPRLVTRADGTAYHDPAEPGPVLLTATSAGPGWFPTGHASVWSLDPATLDLRHRADLFLRRDGRVYGDHAVHLVRDGERWLLAASTWGDFDARRRPVTVTLSESTADLTRGVHVLDARPLRLPVDGLRSVGVWDPHLVHDGARWLVGFVSATRYFRFHPALAAGPDLDSLTLLGADPHRRECEGTTVLRTDAGWRVLASDRRRRTYPVLDAEDAGLREVGALAAAYPGNIPWPTLVEPGPNDPVGGALLVGFDGERYGGELVGYGSHGRVVVQRQRPVSR